MYDTGNLEQVVETSSAALKKRIVKQNNKEEIKDSKMRLEQAKDNGFN